MERKKFDVDALDRVLSSIADELDDDVNAYLIGGLAMIKQDMKLVTKDIDIVFDDENMLRLFIDAASSAGFQTLTDLPPEYIDLGTRVVLEGTEGVRFDVFFKVVCQGLELFPTMMERANKIDYHERLSLYMASLEDIFLFKSITTRPDDLLDMAAIVEAGLNWDIIEEEARSQKDSWKWIEIMHRRLVELEKMTGTDIPLLGRLSTDAKVSTTVWRLIDRLQESTMSEPEIYSYLNEEDNNYIEKVIQTMKTVSRIRINDGQFELL